MSLYDIVYLTVAIVGFATATGTYLATRRQRSGRVGTSEAEVLWKQSQAMYEAAIRERDDARAQRDKIMTAQSDQVIPILSGVLAAVQQITGSIAIMQDELARLDRKWGR